MSPMPSIRAVKVGWKRQRAREGMSPNPCLLQDLRVSLEALRPQDRHAKPGGLPGRCGGAGRAGSWDRRPARDRLRVLLRVGDGPLARGRARSGDPGQGVRARASGGGRVWPPGRLPPQLGLGAGPARVLHRGGGHAAACLGEMTHWAVSRGPGEFVPWSVE